MPKDREFALGVAFYRRTQAEVANTNADHAERSGEPRLAAMFRREAEAWRDGAERAFKGDFGRVCLD